MLASNNSGSESDFESILEGESTSSYEVIFLSDSDLEELEGSFSGNLPVTQEYSLTVKFKNKVEKELKKSTKSSTIKLWNKVIEKEVIEDRGNDQRLRPLFVDLQIANEGAITSLLENKGIRCSVGVIHTPTPATPLRTDEKLENIKKVVSQKVADDPKCLATVIKRVEGVRKYLKEEGTLHSVYENDEVPGMEIFNSVVQQYPNNLFAKKLNDIELNIPTGATYLFGNDKEQALSFFIEITQANVASSESASFGYACVDLNKKSGLNKVEKHLEEVNSFLCKCGISMIEEYKQKVSTSLEQVQITQPLEQRGLSAA